MELFNLRYNAGEESTLGLLFESGNFLCYTLEDQKQDVKIKHETRIPEGRYKITLRTEGGFNKRYSGKFPDIHKGMLWIRDIPEFEYVLIHIGNDDDDTSGCILVGDTASQNITKNGFIGSSTDAYKRIYPKIAKEIEECGHIIINIIDINDISTNGGLLQLNC